MTRLKEMKREKPGFDFGEFAGGLLLAAGKNRKKIMGWFAAGVIALAALTIAAGFFAVEAINREIEEDGKTVAVAIYYSHICSGCERQELIVESLLPEFGDLVSFERKCVTLIGENPEKCIKEQGMEKYERNMGEAMGLGTEGVPILLVGEEKFVGKQEQGTVRAAICRQVYGFWHLADVFGNEIKACRQG